MLMFFICMFFVNLLVAMVQWAMLQYSFKQELSALGKKINSYWEEKLGDFDLSVTKS